MEEEYQDLLKSGMFWEFYPELTGDYEKDKSHWKIIYQNLVNIRNMNAPEYDKPYEFKKFEYVKVPKSNLKPDIGSIIERNFQPKPILFIQVPRHSHEDFEKMADDIEKQVNEVGWFLLWAFSNKDEYEIQSFTLKDSQEIELEKLKEQIINAIKGN